MFLLEARARIAVGSMEWMVQPRLGSQLAAAGVSHGAGSGRSGLSDASVTSSKRGGPARDDRYRCLHTLRRSSRAPCS